MFSFFSRQEGVKKAEGFRPGEKGYPLTVELPGLYGVVIQVFLGQES